MSTIQVLKSQLSAMRQRQTVLKRTGDRKFVMSTIAQNSNQIFQMEQQLVQVKSELKAAMTPQAAAQHELKRAEQRLRGKRDYYMQLATKQRSLKEQRDECTSEQLTAKAEIQRELQRNKVKLQTYFSEIKSLKRAYSMAHTAVYQLSK